MAAKWIPKLKDMQQDAPHKPVKLFLHTHVGGYERRRPVTRIHASDVTSDRRPYCPRESALLLTTGTKPGRNYINTSTRYTFDLGNSIEALIGVYMADVVVGDWVCLACKRLKLWSKKPKKCVHCKSTSLKYIGSRFTSQESGISSGVDVLAQLPGQNKLRIIELKTMVKEEFKALKAPLAEHTVRTRMYMRCAEESGDSRRFEVDTSEASVLYCCKGFGFKDEELLAFPTIHDTFSPFKEFIVKRDDESIADFVERGRMFHLYKTGQAGIPQGICPTPMDKRAKQCTMCKECFGGEYPAGEVFYQEPNDE